MDSQRRENENSSKEEDSDIQDSTPGISPSSIFENVDNELNNYRNSIRDDNDKIYKKRKYPQRYYLLLNPNPEKKHNEHLQSLLVNETLTTDSIVIWQNFKNNKYFHFRNYQAFCRYENETKNSEKCFNEVIFSNSYQKPYFDIDAEGLSTEDGRILLKQVMAAIMKVHPQINLEDIMVFSSHRDGKVSYHIIVDRWCVINNKQNKAFCQLVCTHVDPRFVEYIDKLYRSKQNLRVYGSMKTENHIHKKLDVDNTWKMEDCNEWQIMGASLVTNVPNCKILPSYPVPEEEEKKVAKEFLNDEVNIIFGKVDDAFKHNNISFPFEILGVKNSMIFLKRLASSYCPICKKDHDNQNPYIFTVGINKAIYLNCRRNKKHLPLGKLYNHPEPIKEYTIPKEIAEEKLDLDNNIITHVYKEKFVKPLTLTNKLQAIKSPMGTGKTHGVTNVMKLLPPEYQHRILAVASRRSFALDCTSRFNKSDLQFKCYLDGQEDEYEGNLVISAESLHNANLAYDVVIIDESTSFLAQMDSGLHKRNLSYNRKRLESLIRNAKYVFFMDADITQSTFKLIRSIYPTETIEYHRNDFQNSTDLKVYMQHNELEMFKHMERCLNEGKRIQVVLGSEALGMSSIEPFLKNLKIQPGETGYIFHHSKGSDYPDIVRDVNTGWSKCRVLIYTSTIGSGIDFSDPYFHVRFSFPNSLSGTARSFGQMRMRVRNLIDNTEFMYINHRKDHFQTCFDKIKERHESFLANSSLYAKQILEELRGFEIHILCVDTKKMIWKYEDNFWVWLTIYLEREVNISCNYFKFLIYRNLKRDGVTIVEPPPIDTSKEYIAQLKTFSAWKKNMKKQLNTEIENKYDEIDMDEQDAEQLTYLIKSGNATENDKLASNKLHIAKKITIGQILWGQNCMAYSKYQNEIYSLQIELEMSHLAIIIEDIEHSQYTNIPKPFIAQYINIRQICQKLGVKNTYDRESIIYGKEIHGHLQWYQQRFSQFQVNFKLTCDEPPEYKQLITMISSILTRWSRTRLKKLKGEKKIGKKSFYNYKLVGAEGFDEIYNILAPRKLYGAENIQDGKVGDNLLEQVQSLNDNLLRKENDKVNIDSFQNIDIQLQPNDIRKYFPYTSPTGSVQDWIKLGYLVFKSDIGWHYTEIGKIIKQQEDTEILRLLSLNAIFEYKNPSNSSQDGYYYNQKYIDELPHNLNNIY